MDRRFAVQRAYAEALRDHSAQAYMTALRFFCPRYLDSFSIADEGDKDAFLPTERERCVVPVGGLEFVQECLHVQRDAGLYGNPDAVDVEMTPIEVPDALMPYAGREYHRMLGCDIPEDMLDGSRWFAKDAGILKRWNSALHDSGTIRHLIDADTLYVVSERVTFVSEWRLFVHEDEIISCENYVGDALAFPDAGTIREMMSAYAEASHPRAYTLDIGVIERDGRRQTVPIEVHPFVACGLYGMYDMLIPEMLEAGYQWYLHQDGE